MTIKELRALLELYPDDTVVLAFDDGVSVATPVTGAEYSEKYETLELTTND